MVQEPSGIIARFERQIAIAQPCACSATARSRSDERGIPEWGKERASAFQARAGRRVARRRLRYQRKQGLPPKLRAHHRLDDFQAWWCLVQRDAERGRSPIRKLIFLSPGAGNDSSLCPAPASTVTVSKNASDRGANPSLRNPAAKTLVRRCTVRANVGSVLSGP